MKKLSLAFMLVLFAIGATLAQRTIMGTVTDAEDDGLIGANVLVEGTTLGTITDIEGQYTLEVPDGTAALFLSYTGSESPKTEIELTDVFDLSVFKELRLSEFPLEELGAQKDKKTLSRAIFTIRPAHVERQAVTDMGPMLPFAMVAFPSWHLLWFFSIAVAFLLGASLKVAKKTVEKPELNKDENLGKEENLGVPKIIIKIGKFVFEMVGGSETKAYLFLTFLLGGLMILLFLMKST